jgi:hypothetical protein
MFAGRGGFSASNRRSAIRLNAIAQVRAQAIAATTSRNNRQPGQPWFPRAATHRRQGKRQGEDRVLEFHELHHFLSAPHRTASVEP